MLGSGILLLFYLVRVLSSDVCMSRKSSPFLYIECAIKIGQDLFFFGLILMLVGGTIYNPCKGTLLILQKSVL